MPADGSAAPRFPVPGAPDLDYTVRVSSRARHVRLTVTARDGLVVVVPRGVRVDTERLVALKAAWARRALSRVGDKRALFAAGPEALLPDRVALPLSGIDVAVVCESAGGSSCRAQLRDRTLVVSGPADAEARLAALRRWLSAVARETLPVRLGELAAAHNLAYSAVRVTSARSRWGSCSARGTISLNRTLLFLPPELADAVMLHELAHTRSLDHSARFWSVLEALDPRARVHRRALAEAGALVPAWAEG